jgi:hypothetical protein
MYSILYVLYNHWVLLCARALRSSVFLGSFTRGRCASPLHRCFLYIPQKIKIKLYARDSHSGSPRDGLSRKNMLRPRIEPGIPGHVFYLYRPPRPTKTSFSKLECRENSNWRKIQAISFCKNDTTERGSDLKLQASRISIR